MASEGEQTELVTTPKEPRVSAKSEGNPELPSKRKSRKRKRKKTKAEVADKGESVGGFTILGDANLSQNQHVCLHF